MAPAETGPRTIRAAPAATGPRTIRAAPAAAPLTVSRRDFLGRRYCAHAARLLYGSPGDEIATVQSLSGTGSLRLCFEFLKRHYPDKTVYGPSCTWANHWNILRDAGMNVEKYAYLDAAGLRLDWPALYADLEQAPDGSIVLLHLCAHNPSGNDPTRDQWKELAALAKRKNFLPLFDSAYPARAYVKAGSSRRPRPRIVRGDGGRGGAAAATSIVRGNGGRGDADVPWRRASRRRYLGFASGDVDADAWPFRHFVDEGLAPWACVSFSKNFGLYSERAGAVHATCADAAEAAAVKANLGTLARALYSNPPAFGARLVAEVLGDDDLEKDWRQCLVTMSGRIAEMREALRAALETRVPDRDWSHITSQIGMFSYTGLSAPQVMKLRADYHVYMLESGRLSMAGVTKGNVEPLADAIQAVLKEE